MPHSFGYRAKTRDLFARPFRCHGPEHLSTYMTIFKKGNFVDIVGNGSIHKGMPHKFYHGRTGRVFDISPNSIGVIINKQVRNRIVQKRIHVRVEHLRISTCNSNFKKHVREVEKNKREHPEDKKILKRSPVGPKAEQKIIVDDKSEIHFYNPDFKREIF
ncbi:MAG: 60S ribosomal protein L21 [archaeon]|nr:60S ribosomal protein L21 [archaeon]